MLIVELYELQIKNLFPNMWADTILIVFISICTALLDKGKKHKKQYFHKCIYKLKKKQNNLFNLFICSNIFILYILFRFDMVNGV